MSTVTRKRCDGCNAERAVGDTGDWYHLYRCDPREFDTVGNSDAFDFCSLPCLSSWAIARELPPSGLPSSVIAGRARLSGEATR